MLNYFIIPITWLQGLDHGYANGYVVLPKGHKYHGVGYDEIDVDVHGGLTFAKMGEDCHFEEGRKYPTAWIVGFDTCHYGDTLDNWDKEHVIIETSRLQEQLNEPKN